MKEYEYQLKRETCDGAIVIGTYATEEEASRNRTDIMEYVIKKQKKDKDEG